MPGGRVLMIAHHFPPTSGSGSNRALAFARYLPEYGWQPTVLTPGAAWAVARDERLQSEVPAGMRVVRTRSFEPRAGGVGRPSGAAPVTRQPGALRRHAGHLRRFPDAHAGWLPFALGAARRERFDVAYSSSGPFTSHLVGMLLKRISRKPWVAELRDGWYRWNRAIFPDYPVWRDVLERRLEAMALRSADRVVLVTERMAQAFRCQYADLPANHFDVVPNGFDGGQFDLAPRRAAGTPGWELLHAGALYYGRSLSALLSAAERLVQTDAEFARDFRLTLLGTLDAAAADEVRHSSLGERVQVRAQLEHAAALEAMREADALLLIANTTPGAEATVPGKLFEYLAIGRPIVAVAPRESSTADVLNVAGADCAWLAPGDDAGAIGCALRQAYASRAMEPKRTELARFDRRLLSGDLARIFDQVVGSATRRL